MHDLAIVSKIQKIEPIEGKDRIALATVENYNTIIQKDEFKVGDNCVYVFYDSILPPKPEYEFLRKRCWSDKWQGFRIRPMKMGNVISEGLVLPMSVLSPDKNYRLGQIVTDELEIRYYDPDDSPEITPKKNINPLIKKLLRFAWFRQIHNKFFVKAKVSRSYPSWINKSDEENIEKCYDKISSDGELKFIVSEKMEGQAATFSIEKGKFKVYSHNTSVNSGNWVEVAKIYNIEEKLKRFCKSHKLKNIALQGEICGPGIQRNIYGFNNLKLFIYGGWFEDHTRIEWSEVENICKELNLPIVPVLSYDSCIYDLNKMIEDADGDSIYKNNNKTVPREGLVWRTENGNIHFKNKSRAYKIWFDKKENG